MSRDHIIIKHHDVIVSVSTSYAAGRGFASRSAHIIIHIVQTASLLSYQALRIMRPCCVIGPEGGASYGDLQYTDLWDPSQVWFGLIHYSAFSAAEAM